METGAAPALRTVRCVPELGAIEQITDDCIAEEYWVRRRWGDRPARLKFEKRFPLRASTLGKLLDVIDARGVERAWFVSRRARVLE
jgi:hypothetical protein